jgi:2-aminoethylphosphonate-pyruvate transaminase
MLLLIPGPVTTRPEVRHALTRDIAPWDNDFRHFLTGLRGRILRLAGGLEDQHATLPLQGCGHFITEAALRTFLPPGGRILIPASGAYADRMIRLAREAGRTPVPLPMGLTDTTDPQAVAVALQADPTLTHVGMVYSETGSGVIHDVQAVGAVVRAAGRRMIIDAVSAFGALPLDLSTQPEVDAAVFTTNKCLEALPGVAFACRQRRKLVVRPVQHLRPCLEGRLGQLPVHTPGADPGRLGRRAGLPRSRRPVRSAGALHRQHARPV